jgi:hypothetical protein
MSISITLDDELGEELNAAVAGSNRSAFVAEALREYLDRRAVAAAADWHASQVLGQDGQLGLAGLGVPEAGVGELDVDAAPVVLAVAALDQPALLQAGDRAGQGALAQVHRRGEILHAALVTVSGGETVERLEVAHGEAVRLLQRALERGRRPRCSWTAAPASGRRARIRPPWRASYPRTSPMHQHLLRTTLMRRHLCVRI